MPPHTLILAPLKLEAAALQRHLPSAAVHIIGIRATRFPPKIPPTITQIILAGLAGALDPALRAGDLVIDTPASDQLPSQNAHGVAVGHLNTNQKPPPNLPLHPGRIHSADHLITTSSEKSRLRQETGCIAVDMESAVVRQFCHTHNLNFLHIRAISDEANESLPEHLADWVDELGQPDFSRLIPNLALNPTQIPALLRLQKNSRLALRNLCRYLQSMIDTL